ncbi:MAG: SGNH/GDSL hydrolase family protein, partial [Vulcanimicrobiaceae bacterium]
MFKRVLRPLAVLSMFALAACGGGGGSSSGPSVVPPQSGNAILTTIVGVGDSLTAGYQSSGFLGVPGVTSPVSAYPGGAVPPGQENGFWALLYAQAKGLPPTALYDPAQSPLPLISGPGLGNQLVLGANGLPTPTHAGGNCDQFNQAAFQLSTALSTVRANPNGKVFDVAVPGQTAHEALAMVNPLTAPPTNPPVCSFASNPNDPTAGGLQTLVFGESFPFYPVLGGFAGKIPHLDQVDAAVSLHPTLATVWLGANDLLKFTFSGGQTSAQIAIDSPQQMQTDITQTITKLQQAGAKVVVANLPDVLNTAQFFLGGAPPSQQACQLQNYVLCFTTQVVTGGLVAKGVPLALAQAEAQAVAQQVVMDIQTSYAVGANGYLTETGMFTALQEVNAQLAAGAQPSQIQVQLDRSGKGSGLGGAYLPDAFAGQVQTLNDAYNAAIGAAAQSTGAQLVDIEATFKQLHQQGAPITASCCSLVFGGGLLSFDGLHPSNTGYALV